MSVGRYVGAFGNDGVGRGRGMKFWSMVVVEMLWHMRTKWARAQARARVEESRVGDEMSVM